MATSSNSDDKDIVLSSNNGPLYPVFPKNTLTKNISEKDLIK